MAKKKQSVPEYGTVTRKGTLYYRTRITDADGKQVSLYATTCEELYEKQLEARRQVEADLIDENTRWRLKLKVPSYSAICVIANRNFDLNSSDT